MKTPVLFLSLLINYGSVFAQQAFTNSGNLQIHSGGSIAGAGNFTNTSTGVLVNNGNFYNAGNFTNDQSGMAAGAGTLYLNGTSLQTINGSQAVRTLNLVTNNSAGINIANNLHVSGTHTFTAGLITTAATPNYLVYEAGSSHSGTADARHVNGWVKKIGNTNFSFPIGNGTYLRSAAIENLSVSSEFNARYFTPTPNISSLVSPIKLLKTNEYWQVNRVSGGTARIGLNWNHSKVTMDNVVVADISVVYYTGGGWNDIGGTASGNVATTGTISSNSVNAFGSFTLGYKTFPVPLKLISFSGERKAGVTYLNWTTVDEQNVDRFEIQRSNNGTDFITIGNVAARNLSSIQTYSFNDPFALDGIVYYRLRLVDVDAKFSYSQVIIFSDKISDTKGFIVANPARQHITVFNKTGQPGMVEYNLITTSGQQVMQGNIYMNANAGALIDLPGHIPVGVYVLNLRKGTLKFSQKIIVEK